MSVLHEKMSMKVWKLKLRNWKNIVLHTYSARDLGTELHRQLGIDARDVSEAEERKSGRATT